jgi:ribose transport system substrate-binding protein
VAVKPRSAYAVKSVVHACAVLRAFQQPADDLRLCDVVSRTGFRKGMCFRLLHTLHLCGLIERAGNRYRLAREFGHRRRYRIGYAGHGCEGPFPRDVQASLSRAAERAGMDLIAVEDGAASGSLGAAEHLIRKRVDLVIEFQIDEALAPAITSKYLRERIPVIVIDGPQPGATYFGANNYEAGILAGRCLGNWGGRRFSSRVDEILLLESARARSSAQMRMRGVLAGIKEVLRDAERCAVVALDGDGRFTPSLERVRRHLRRSKAKRFLVGAVNDQSALGAVRAFQEAGRSESCAVVGQHAEPDARAELRDPRTPLIATVGYFPEKYGDGLVRLAVDILGRRRVPPAVFVRHEVITHENVDRFYPNRALISATLASA